MKAPLFWRNPPERPGWQAHALWPATLLWRWAADRRSRQGAHWRAPIPVICVGNITVGGAGKTPTAIWLAEHLRDLGVTAHLVSRGHGGRAPGPLRVKPTMDAAEVGDEPLLLAAFAPTWVAKNRAAGVQEAADAGAQAVILDDGMQNPSVAKDFTLMVVDAAQGFGNGRLIPAGPLRQVLPEGLARADAVLALGPVAARRRLQEAYPPLKRLPIWGGQVLPLQTGMDWTGLRALAFAGIARPEKFFDTLAGLGAEVVGAHGFADHAAIPDSVMARLAREAREKSAQLVTTEKDAARLGPRWRGDLLVLPVRLFTDDRDAILGALEPLFMARSGGDQALPK